MKTIGQVIEELKKMPQDFTIYFDFCGTIPDGIFSWRGIYAEAALGWRENDYNIKRDTPKDLIGQLEDSIDGMEFDGWKGGS